MPSPFNSNHFQWLPHTETINSSDGKPIEIYTKNEEILNEWTKHFRPHYCLDTDIDDLREGSNKTRKKLLNEFILNNYPSYF